MGVGDIENTDPNDGYLKLMDRKDLGKACNGMSAGLSHSNRVKLFGSNGRKVKPLLRKYERVYEGSSCQNSDKPRLIRYGVKLSRNIVAQHNSSNEELHSFCVSLIKELGCDESQMEFASGHFFFVTLTEEQAQKLSGVENVEKVWRPMMWRPIENFV